MSFDGAQAEGPALLVIFIDATSAITAENVHSTVGKTGTVGLNQGLTKGEVAGQRFRR
jgi:hypothetical protein